MDVDTILVVLAGTAAGAAAGYKATNGRDIPTRAASVVGTAIAGAYAANFAYAELTKHTIFG
jgi:hypothetical protein